MDKDREKVRNKDVQMLEYLAKLDRYSIGAQARGRLPQLDESTSTTGKDPVVFAGIKLPAGVKVPNEDYRD